MNLNGSPRPAMAGGRFAKIAECRKSAKNIGLLVLKVTRHSRARRYRLHKKRYRNDSLQMRKVLWSNDINAR